MTAHAVNGWPVPPESPVHVWQVQATIPVSLLDNYAGFCMAHFLVWYDDTIEPLQRGQTFGGINEARPPRGSANGITNHAAYLAVDANSLEHGQGTHERHLSDRQVRAISDRLYWYDRIARGFGPDHRPAGWDSNSNAGILRWGHDYKRAPEDDMHYEWNRTPSGMVAGQRLANHLIRTPRGIALMKHNPTSRYVKSMQGNPVIRKLVEQ
jgi:hypothetical protein